MYELNRARLVGIGPRGARYSDVTLDLSALGEAVAPRNLFDQPARRPSPFSLLLLENGGGKSVLLKLLFSVVLPGRRHTVGGTSLEKFVLDDDTGHVALEWMHVTTGERLVTAKVYQRRTPAGANKNPLAEAWYSFRPNDILDLDTLPVIADGRRRRLDGFREALEEADRQTPTTELSWLGDDQGRWRIHLRERGIEPDLFEIQRRMNVDEGEAAKAFKYSSAKDFVDWLLKTVTDPKDASSVADTFSQWAANLAAREQMLLEQDFLQGVIDALDLLAEAHQEHQAASREATAAVNNAGRLAAALTGRLEAEQDAANRLADEHRMAQTTATTRATERDAARALLNEVRRQTLQLRLNQTKEDQAETAEQRATAQLELAGWQIIATIEERDQAVSIAKQLAAQVKAADQDAAPALARRDEAAGQLLAKYLAEAEASDQTAKTHDAQVAAAKHQADAADAARSDALGEIATARERHRSACGVITDAEERLAKAAAEELVPVGAVPGDVPGLAEHARAEHNKCSGRLAKRKGEVAELTRQIGDADRNAADADTALRQAAGVADTAARDLQPVEQEAERLASMPLLAEAAGVGTLVEGETGVGGFTTDALDEASDRLVAHLTQDIADHTRHLDALRAEQNEDERVADALGNGGLLPARAEVERALEVLAAAGIAAHAGWRYLAEAAAAAERAELIASHPALADGVVLVDSTQLDTARKALAHARLLPAAAVAVGPGAALLVGAGDDVRRDRDGPAVFVVDPTPALYDEDAAANRRVEIRELMTRRGAQLQQNGKQLAAVREAHGDLSRWRRDNPRGRLNQLRDLLTTARSQQDAAQKRLDECRIERNRLAEEREQAEDAAARAATDERHTAERATAVEALADNVAAATRAQRSLPEHEADLHRAQDTAEQALGRRRSAEHEHNEHTRLAEQARAQAERHRAACAEVPSTSGEPATEVPGEPLAVLKAAASATQQVYLAAAVDPNLRHEAEGAAQRVQNLRNALAQRDPDHVAEAERLRATPAGADRAAWSVGADNARRTVLGLSNRIDELNRTVGQLEQSVKDASPTEPGRRSWTTLNGQWHPTTPEHGQQLELQAQEEARRAQTQLEEANAKVANLDKQRKDVVDAVHQVKEALLPLTALLSTIPDRTTTEPYADVATAKRAAAAAVTELRDSSERADRCHTELTTAVTRVVGFANQSRYQTLATQARRSITDSTREALAARAAEWSASLTARQATLASDLDNANRHRKSIVDRLTALTDQALKTLRRAMKLSQLPDDLVEWAGHPFLKIVFSDPDRTTMTVRVGEVVDRVASDYAARSTGGTSNTSRRDGMSLLLEAVHAAVPKGFTVDVLKPDSVLRNERVSIENVNDVFSGGQELTAAILLYCTLAALRANERGQMRSRHSGVLFLDNPIGRANASYLLDLQQSVARSLGIQLIYTTGITDDRVLAAFPLWIRLRNDADLRAGLKYIQVADVVRQQLPGPYTEDEIAGGSQAAPGTVTAARVHRRPAQPEQFDKSASLP